MSPHVHVVLDEVESVAALQRGTHILDQRPPLASILPEVKVQRVLDHSQHGCFWPHNDLTRRLMLVVVKVVAVDVLVDVVKHL